MKALIKNDKHGLNIMTEPFDDWIDPIAFSVFDCYGYSLCENYHESENPRFEFSTRTIANPWKQLPEDPDTVIQRVAIDKVIE